MKLNTKMRNIIAIAALILIWVEFLATVAFDKYAVYQWPTVPGSITEAYDGRRTMYNNDANGNPSYEDYTTIGFSYTVGGGDYFNRTEVNQGQVGQEVTVYYNPNNPAQSAVTRGGGSQISQPVGSMIVTAIIIQVAALIVVVRRLYSNTDTKSVSDNNEAWWEHPD